MNKQLIRLANLNIYLFDIPVDEFCENIFIYTCFNKGKSLKFSDEKKYIFF